MQSVVQCCGFKNLHNSLYFLSPLLKLFFFCRHFTPCRHFWSVIFMSCNFMSCNFMPCNFDGPSFSRPAFSVNPFHAAAYIRVFALYTK